MTDTHTSKQIYLQEGRHTYIQKYIQIDRTTYIETDMSAGRQYTNHRQTFKIQRDRKKNRQTYTLKDNQPHEQTDV